MVTVGVDEVGRGCWAGPLVAGAVILAEPVAGLKDSKKLSKKQREELDVKIRYQAAAVGYGWVYPAEIDEIGLTRAVQLAMRLALEDAAAGFKGSIDEIIIDGNLNFFPENPKARAVVKADDSVPAASAASIVAKVARDNYMAQVAESYPDYGFEQHVGYGTALHAERLQLYGVSDLHRRSFKPIQALVQ